MSDELVESAEFGRKKKDEEEPILVAQRFLNIYRQMHIFNKERQEQFDDMLLALPSDIRILLSTLPGGSLLLEHIEEVEHKRGLVSPNLNVKSGTNFRKKSAEDLMQSPAPSAPKADSAPKPTTNSGGGVIIDASFASELSNSLSFALQQTERRYKDDIRALTETITRSITESQTAIASMMKDVVLASQVAAQSQAFVAQNTAQQVKNIAAQNANAAMPNMTPAPQAPINEPLKEMAVKSAVKTDAVKEIAEVKPTAEVKLVEETKPAAVKKAGEPQKEVLPPKETQAPREAPAKETPLPAVKTSGKDKNQADIKTVVQTIKASPTTTPEKDKNEHPGNKNSLPAKQNANVPVTEPDKTQTNEPAKPADNNAEIKQEVKSEVKSEIKVEIKPKEKAETSTENQSEAKPSNNTAKDDINKALPEDENPLSQIRKALKADTTSNRSDKSADKRSQGNKNNNQQPAKKKNKSTLIIPEDIVSLANLPDTPISLDDIPDSPISLDDIPDSSLTEKPKETPAIDLQAEPEKAAKPVLPAENSNNTSALQTDNDDDWEWEYVDENGTPESEGSDDEWEWEYVEDDGSADDGDSDDWEWEYVEDDGTTPEEKKD